jgi:hypothetical protein
MPELLTRDNLGVINSSITSPLRRIGLAAAGLPRLGTLEESGSRPDSIGTPIASAKPPMLIFRDGRWHDHKPWAISVLIVSALAVFWFVAERYTLGEWPRGSSLPGVIFGCAGLLIILFEMLLWLRKRGKLRVVRLIRAKYWMTAHIWLGLLSLPLVLCHSGFRFWNRDLSGILMGVFLIVIASGVWGLVMQQVIPSRMLDEVPAEAIRSQIGPKLDQLLKEASRLVRITCGEINAPDSLGEEEDWNSPSFGVVRTAGVVQDSSLTRRKAVRVDGAGSLLDFFNKEVAPFFTRRGLTRSRLRSATKSAALFGEFKDRLSPAAHPVIETLEEFCELRRQLARQERLHNWLYVWQCVHIPLSFALLILLGFHIYYSLKYM